MPSMTPRRRKNPDSSGENYYKILEVHKNARAEVIKQNYIRLVKLFSPETHPNEFQQIRQAYETLRDPVKRRQYDLTRKYGTDIDSMLEQAMGFIMTHQWKKATKLVETVIEMSPEFVGGYLCLANIALVQGNQSRFDAEMERAFNLAKSKEEQVSAYLIKAQMLASAERFDQALDVLDQAEMKHPDEVHVLTHGRVNLYLSMERYQDAFHLSTTLIPEPDDNHPDDISEFILWINTMIQAEQWHLWSKVKSRMRRFLRSVQGEGDKELILSFLDQESREWEKGGDIRAAQLFTGFCLDVVPKNRVQVERRRYLEGKQRLEAEMERISSDQNIFPWVGLQAIRWFGELVDREDVLEAAAAEMDDVAKWMEEIQHFHEKIADGITRLKKTYPQIYHQFQDKWDTAFAEHAGSVNREVRRRLRQNT